MIRQELSRLVTNIRGWSTDRKIIIIESDDWGSIRMPSSKTYEECIKAGYPVDKNEYERYDSLESEEDLDMLFNLLLSFKDKHGNSPVITANCVVANPDFDRIKADDFECYHYELITETYKKYPQHSRSFELWKEGMDAKIFHPQYHCREHLNVSLFMNDLRHGRSEALFGFDHRMPGCISAGTEETDNYYINATNYNSPEDKKEKLSIYLEGLDLFEDLFGYRSRSIIPSNYLWSSDFNPAVRAKGVRYIQGLRKMWEPRQGGNNISHDCYLGKRNRHDLISLVRNATFEPSMPLKGINDPVNYCLSDISIAFRMQKPAVISSHRINYIGYIDEKNRSRSLRQLRSLLTEACKRWPEVEFLTSDQLGEMITRKN